LAACGAVGDTLDEALGTDDQGQPRSDQQDQPGDADGAASAAGDAEGTTSASGEGAASAVSESELADRAQIDEIMARLSVSEQIGQVLMPAVFGQSDQLGPADAAANTAAHGAPTPSEIVALHDLGGLIYLPDNIVSADQVRALSDAVQVSAGADTGLPLLIAVDQEGGRVSRLTDEVSPIPSAASLAGAPDEVRQAGYITGQQVGQQGINVVLAPVADVVSVDAPTFISDRSYGSDPEVVAAAVAAAIDGLQTSGVAAAVKHWPGHGATPVDSHERLPSVDVERPQWEQREAVPFRAAFDEQVAVVLVGHLALPRLDPSGAPATLSPLLIDDLLRGELGFDGVVMTDALNMGAVSGYDEGELVVSAFLAGNDIILMPPSTTVAADALRAAVADGRISPERLELSVRRILELKQQLGLLGPAN
jgi:beta-N-acetylhexosaminidase